MYTSVVREGAIVRMAYITNLIGHGFTGSGAHCIRSGRADRRTKPVVESLIYITLA